MSAPLLNPTVTRPAHPGVLRVGRVLAGWPGLVFGLSLGLNLFTAWQRGFDGLYGQDAYSYFAQSVELQTHFSLFHHWQWEAGPRLFYWPFGYPAQVALFSVFTGATPGAAQLVSLLAGAGSAAFLTSLGRKMSGSRTAGLVAGVGLALSPLFRQVSVSVMADAPALFWTVLAVWLAWKARESGRGGWLLGAGVAFGLAGITRYAGLTALPLLWLIWLWPGPAQKGPAPGWVIGATGLAGLVCLPQLIINQVYPANFWYSSWLADWSPLNAFQTRFQTRDGLGLYAFPPLLFYLGGGLLSLNLLTPLALPLVGLGLDWLARIKSDWFQLAVLGVWWIAPVALFSGIPYENERFSLTFLPPLALLAGLGTARLPDLLSSGGRRWLQVAFKGGLALAALGLLVISQRHLDGFIAVKDSDMAVIREVEARIPASATLVTFEISLTFDHYTGLKVQDLSFLDSGSLSRLLGGGPVYLLADPANMARQWSGSPVGQAFEAAYRQADGPPLVQVGRFSLWKLKP